MDTFLRITLVIALILLFGNPAVADETPADGQQISMAIPCEPIPLPSANGINLAYELELHPPEGEAPVVDRVDVIDPATGTVIYTVDGDLLASLYHPASIPPPTNEERMAGSQKLIFPRISLWFVVSPDAVPDRLTHRLFLNQTGDEAAEPITGGEVAVRKDFKPVVLASPVKGDGWIIMESTAPTTHHFLAQITMNNMTRVPQRYAQDIMYLDPETHEFVTGNASLARNCLGFGKELLAVADGTVVEATDGLPDLEIISSNKANVSTAAGNSVLIDIGDNKYACYGHMVNGSVRVKKGDVVKEGDVIGLMGNSGNSGNTHLHFQVVNGSPSFLGAEGYPHVFKSFAVTGKIRYDDIIAFWTDPDHTEAQFYSDFAGFITFNDTPEPHENEIMENNVIVWFH